MKRLFVGLMILGGLLAGRVAARGEVFLLTNGGRVEGQWLNRDEHQRQNYQIRLSSGGQLTLENAQVKKVVEPRPDESEYEKIRPQYPDTVEGQWKLAQWCQDHQLTAQRKTHLLRVIELDPNHVQARRALGYSKFDGQWMTQEEKMTKEGYRLYKGRWRSEQEIELIEKKRKEEVAAKDWYQKLKRWRGWLGSGRDQQGRDNITGINDPLAVGALALGMRDDTQAPARLLYIDSLAKIATPAATGVLAKASMEDKVEEVRLTSLDQLEKNKSPEVVSYYIGQLRSKDNIMVNRAGYALGRLKDPSAVSPLIDALWTVHKYKIITGNPGSMSSTFSNGPSGSGASGGMGGMGFGAGGGGPKIVSERKFNQAVLDSLVTLTGQNFVDNQRAWRAWYNAQKKAEVGGASRRD